MRKLLVLFSCTTIFCCGGQEPRQQPITEPETTPEPAPPCQILMDPVTGSPVEVGAGFTVSMTHTAFAVGNKDALFFFTMRGLNNPGCGGVHIDSIIFDLIGNKQPAFSNWTLFDDTQQEEGVLAEGPIGSGFIEVKPHSLVLSPGKEKHLILMIGTEEFEPGYGFTLKLAGPITWTTMDGLHQHQTSLPVPLTAQYSK